MWPSASRIPAALIVALLAAGGCGGGGGESATQRHRAGDGVVDCAAGQVARDAGVEVTAGSEAEAVRAVLAQWSGAAAALVELPEDESWSVVVDGRDVAVAYPEQNGDGTWTVHAVTVCGDPDTGAQPIDGDPDCATDAGWAEQGSIGADVTGFATAEEAIEDALAPFVARHGGSIELVRDSTGSIVVGGREVVVAIASRLGADVWIVTTISGCPGFER